MMFKLYRLAWEPVLWIARALAGMGPASWRLRERLAPAYGASDAYDTHNAEAEPEAARTTETYWLHAASLGECKGLWAFARRLRTALDARPNTHGARILLTANTTVALAYLEHEITSMGRNTAPVSFAARLAPFDHPRLARAFLAAHNVRALVLFEVELWPHWIAAARRAGVPVAWISARLTPRARRRYAGNPVFAGALGRVLRDIAWIQTQTRDEEHALRRLGAPHVETGGDLRGLHALDHTPVPGHVPNHGGRTRPHGEAARRGIAFVSFHARELPALVTALSAALPETDAFPSHPLVVIPRKLHEVPRFLRALAPYGFVLHSQRADATRVIVDAYGLVEKTLTRMRTAVLGGSFGPDTRIGGHNAWEPLLAGCRIVIGPHHHNQNALVERLESRQLIVIARNGDALRAEMARDVNTEATHAQDDTEARARTAFIDEESARLENAARRAGAFILHARD